ncbi:MAG: hypothetical protein ACI9RL_000916, partial [Candidatus Paceibacteria bacterium]
YLVIPKLQLLLTPQHMHKQKICYWRYSILLQLSVADKFT